MTKTSALQKLTFKKGSGNNQQNVTLDYQSVTRAAKTLRAINHKLRQKMLKVIQEHDKITVTDIYQKMRLEQSVASQHLAILRRANVVNTEKEGKQRFYSLNTDRLAEISEMVERLKE